MNIKKTTGINVFVVTIAGLLFGLIATTTAVAGGDQTLLCDAGGNGTVLPVDLCIEPEDASTDWRWVGLSTGTACPQPAPKNWTQEKLFRQDDDPVPPGLNAFCVYVAQSNPPQLQELAALRCTAPNPPENCLARLDTDSVSVAMMGSDMADLIWEPLREQFLNQVGQTEPLPAGPQTVRLAVIDTEPTGFNQDRNGAGTSQHGYTLLNLMRDMICPATGPCAVQLKSGLGLPLIRCNSSTGFCEDDVNGGYVGTISQLAVAIRKEVADWQTSGVNRLVINLSVAWDPVFGGQSPVGNSSVAVQAVHRALQDASCRGALVLAAAGNRVTGPSLNAGPLYPAAWEVIDAPTMSECVNLVGFAPNASIFAGPYRPLIYATGALNADNTTAETRQQGEPRLTAFGDHAVSQTDSGNTAPTQILTGTSVSAAVISAAAAQTWYYDDNLSAHQLMQTVYQSAMPLGRDADFCLNATPCATEVRRVAICYSVEAVCAGQPAGTCPLFECTTPDTVLPALPEADIETLFSTVVPYSVMLLTKTTAVDECRSGYIVHSVPGATLDDPCPHLQYYGLQATPWTDGQPEGQFCPTCTDTYHSPGKLYVDIDTTLEGVLSEITLLCKDDAFRIPGTLVAGGKLVISEIPESCEFENVALAYRHDNGTGSAASVASPSLLIPDRDDDGIQDGLDNCLNTVNPDQTDTDNDGFGNACDGDFTNDCRTNFPDLDIIRQAFLSTDPLTDLNSDGFVNFMDLRIFRGLFFAPPGPSGVDNDCD